MLRHEGRKDELLSKSHAPVLCSGLLPSQCLPPVVCSSHVLFWGRTSSSRLVHHPVSNELPASVKVAGEPCKASHHRTAWQGRGRTAGDDGSSVNSLMTTGRYLPNRQNLAVGREPGLPLAAVDY